MIAAVEPPAVRVPAVTGPGPSASPGPTIDVCCSFCFDADGVPAVAVRKSDGAPVCSHHLGYVTGRPLP